MDGDRPALSLTDSGIPATLPYSALVVELRDDPRVPKLLKRLRAAVSDLGVYGAKNSDALYPGSLALDETRLDETEEAWVRVLTPDGPGVLIWQNSD